MSLRGKGSGEKERKTKRVVRAHNSSANDAKKASGNRARIEDD